MNYPESARILEEIKKVKKILINCHYSPDPDGIGSAIAMFKALLTLNKDVKMVCPSEISKDYDFLPTSREIVTMNFFDLDLSNYDLFMILDSSNWEQVTGNRNNEINGIRKIVVDHHLDNPIRGVTSLVLPETSSTSEIIFGIFEDWGIDLDEEAATALLMGIYSDTIQLQAPIISKKTFEIVGKLVEKGARKEEISLNIYRNLNIETIKLTGYILSNMNIDKSYGFVWSAVPFEVFEKYETSSEATNAKELAVTYFARAIENTKFGAVMVESKKGVVSVSLRTREGFDVSRVAKLIGGGGHEYAAGARVISESFDQGVKIVLDACKKAVEEAKKS